MSFVNKKPQDTALLLMNREGLRRWPPRLPRQLRQRRVEGGLLPLQRLRRLGAGNNVKPCSAPGWTVEFDTIARGDPAGRA